MKSKINVIGNFASSEIGSVKSFNDGNGRIARVMMNAEFVRADQSRIIVPTVFREDYILALRKLTRHKDPLAYINVMTKLHQFSDNLYGTDFMSLKTTWPPATPTKNPRKPNYK